MTINSDLRVTILGLGRSGFATAQFLAKRGAHVLVSESKPMDDKLQSQARELSSLNVLCEFGGHSDQAVDFADYLVTSPGIAPNSPIIQEARGKGKEVISDIELAYRESKVPIIAITGTNGKSTTTALVSHMLSQSGKSAPACGNIGVPILSLLDGNPDYLVVEVSSFQMEYSPKLAPQIGVWLNLTPDHLDWHGGMPEYVHAKQKLFIQQTADQFAVLNRDDVTATVAGTDAKVFRFSLTNHINASDDGAFLRDNKLFYRLNGIEEAVCDQSELKILGRHNLENALAAISVGCLIGLSKEQIRKAVTSFTALEHRLEWVATINGIAYFNDSKATNTDSSIKALEAFPDTKVVLIAGGRDKGTPLREFVRAVRKHASAVILIGEASKRFEKELKDGGFATVYPVGNLDAAVELGGRLRLGPVLLSPACASFDMFRDFEDRGRVFKNLVRSKYANA